MFGARAGRAAAEFALGAADPRCRGARAGAGRAAPAGTGPPAPGRRPGADLRHSRADAGDHGGGRRHLPLGGLDGEGGGQAARAAGAVPLRSHRRSQPDVQHRADRHSRAVGHARRRGGHRVQRVPPRGVQGRAPAHRFSGQGRRALSRAFAGSPRRRQDRRRSSTRRSRSPAGPRASGCTGGSPWPTASRCRSPATCRRTAPGRPARTTRSRCGGTGPSSTV